MKVTLTISYLYNVEGYGAILYKDRAPWEMTPRERHMMEESMEAIFKKYLVELDIEDFVF